MWYITLFDLRIFFNYILFFNFTILYWFCHISTWICHRYTPVPHPEPTSLLPPCTIPLGRPSAPAPSIQYRASDLDWRLVTYIILYTFQCHSPKSSHPLPLPQSKRLSYISVSPLLSRIQGYCYHLSKFHIYALVYCIGVFLSGLLLWGTTSHQSEWLWSKSLQAINAGKGVEKREYSCTVGGNVNWYSYYGRWYGDSLKKN